MREQPRPIGQIPGSLIGNPIAIVECDSDDRKVVTTGILSSIRRIYKENDPKTLERIEVRLGGNDADLRNGMLFVVDEEESEDFSVVFFSKPF